MAQIFKVELTAAEIQTFTLSSLATTQAMLAVVLDTQAHILAKLEGTAYEMEKEALAKAVGDAERHIAEELQTPAAPAQRATARDFRRQQPPTIV